MADRVVKFAFRGDASDLERALGRTEASIEGVGKAAKATSAIVQTAFGVALGISIDKIREKVFQAIGAYKEWFKTTEVGAAATKRLSTEGKRLRDQFFKPLNVELANSIDSFVQFTQQLDPAALDAYARGLAQSIAFLSDLSQGALIAASRVLGLRAAQGDARAEKELAINRQAINLQSQRIEGIRQQIAMQEGVDEATNRFLGTEGETSEQVKELTTDLEKQIGVLKRLKGEIGEAAGLRTVAPTARATPGAAPAAGGAPAAAAALAPVGPTLFDSISAQVQETTTAVGAMYEDLAARAKASREKQEAEAEGLKNSTQALAQEVGAAVTQASQMVLDGVLMEYQKTKDEIADIEDQITKTTDKGAKDRLMRRKRAKEKELEEEKKAAMAAWVANKVAAIAQAAVSMALGIANSLSMGMPQGAVMAAISAVASGAAIAAIAAQPPPSFHAGGLVTGAALRQGNPDDIPASLRAGEFVSTPAAVSRLGRQTLEDAERGRLPSSGGEVVVRFNDRDLDVMHSSRLRAVGSPLQRATASSTRARYSSGRVRRG